MGTKLNTHYMENNQPFLSTIVPPIETLEIYRVSQKKGGLRKVACLVLIVIFQMISNKYKLYPLTV